MLRSQDRHVHSGKSCRRLTIVESAFAYVEGMDECSRVFPTGDFPDISNIVKTEDFNTARFGNTNLRSSRSLTSSTLKISTSPILVMVTFFNR